jgi:hypothetical protein
MVKCPACDFQGSTNDFTMHFAITHGSKGRKRGLVQVPLSCVVKNSNVPTVQTKKNRERKHPDTNSENLSPASLRHKDKIEVEKPSWWNNLDATKDYGYPARESGRYGSHPSHDGFDDESKP